jgi:hypothetical protein
MKRRELLKGLSLVAGGALVVLPEWSTPAIAQDQDKEKPESFASPIRGLVKKNGQFLQPIQISVPRGTGSEVIVTKINGTEADTRVLATENQVFKVLVPAVTARQRSEVECEIDGKPIAATVTLKPVRKIVVYVLPHSHHDLGYTDLQANV